MAGKLFLCLRMGMLFRIVDMFNIDTGQKKIEIRYPELKESPRNKLFYVDATEGSAGNEILKFNVGSYRYFIRQAYFGGLLVKRNHGQVLRQT